MDIQPAAQLLTEQEGFVPLVVTAIKAGRGVHGICWGLKRLAQGLSTADAVQLFGALVESGDEEPVLGSLLLARLADCSADELANLLQLCVDHACCSSLRLLCEQPAADQIEADTVLGLCRDILETGVFGRVGPDLCTALESVLTLAGAELIEPSDAAVLFTGALQSGDVQLAVGLTQLLPQLQDHPSTATAVGSSERLLQLLRSAFSYDSPAAVKMLCGQAVMAQIDAHSRAEILVAAVAAGARYAYEEEGSTWQQPQQVAGVLAQLLPQTLCTREVLLQLLQACAVHACPQLLRVLVSYSAVDELTPDDVEPLLLQCIPWRKQQRAAGRVENFKLLLQLPASQSLSARALMRLLKTAAAGSRALLVQLLKLPGVQLLSSEAVVAVATACLQGQQRPPPRPGHVPVEQWLIMQLPGYLQLCGPQVEGLLQVAFQGGHRSWVEQLLKHPAAPVDSPLVQLYRASSL